MAKLLSLLIGLLVNPHNPRSGRLGRRILGGGRPVAFVE
jgi:hypothetical protein